jgi:hypothetical protein
MVVKRRRQMLQQQHARTYCNHPSGRVAGAAQAMLWDADRPAAVVSSFPRRPGPVLAGLGKLVVGGGWWVVGGWWLADVRGWSMLETAGKGAGGRKSGSAY